MAGWWLLLLLLDRSQLLESPLCHLPQRDTCELCARLASLFPGPLLCDDEPIDCSLIHVREGGFLLVEADMEVSRWRIVPTALDNCSSFVCAMRDAQLVCRRAVHVAQSELDAGVPESKLQCGCLLAAGQAECVALESADWLVAVVASASLDERCSRSWVWLFCRCLAFLSCGWRRCDRQCDILSDLEHVFVFLVR